MKKRVGAFLIETILAAVVLMMAAYGVMQVCSGQFAFLDGSRTAIETQTLAQSKMNEVNATSYDNVTSLAESLTEIIGTNYSREVIVGSESTDSDGNTERTITVNVYKTGEDVARMSFSTVLSSAMVSSSSDSSAHGSELFTSSGTFTVPSGISTVWVSMSGGGGGGSSNSDYSGGGGAAAVLAQETTVTAGASIAVTVGSGGNIGGAGGTSSFGSYTSCAGGGAGSTTGGSAGGTGGTAGETYRYDANGSSKYSGSGGGSIFGSGGGRASSSPAGGGYGGGGGAGGKGSGGFVLVEW
ncbi:MAG: hypothetical protein H6Q69_962 [Firmicutes bacterium]|nr:hypothetical protein [Bacillota bacterium]